ncbi:two-component system, sensor histidine kinase YesM [Amphibacillus marinus]|uniref:Two-component system, sensor histidine kinase YesM n=1 Tax=Amphibacillus marinus TaxID=872970 RepID=A0A1H8RC70_9BACI|nr:histidine kinase [Amphibacillus marinus]SEO63724.1 two-component system, sensor histidine kinase YesM [Amphibacillus marinus]
MRNFVQFKLNVFAKFTLAFITVGIIPIAILTYIALTTVANEVENHTKINYEQSLDYASIRIRDLYKNYNHLTKQMYSYQSTELRYLLGILQDDQTDEYSVNIAIHDFLRIILHADPYIGNVIMVPTHDRIPRSISRVSRVLIPNLFYLHEEYEELIKENYNQLTILPLHKDTYFMGGSQYVLVFARNLLDIARTITPSTPIDATIYVSVSVQAFADVFNELEMLKDDYIYILDKDQQLIYTNQKDIVLTDLDYTSVPEGFSKHVKDISDPDWRIIAHTKDHKFVEQVSHTYALIYGVTTVTIVALLVFSIFFSRSVSYPINKMTRLMKQVELGNLNLEISVNRTDEIGLLANGFNKMVKNLKSHISKVYVAQINQKQAELNALRSQIQPHYLYNTLEVIRMSAIDDGNTQVAEMINHLANQYKYITEHSSELVTIRRELEHLKNYMDLIKFRYENNITFSIEVKDECIYSMLVPKLSIQPIVENAVIHGLLPKGKGEILVVCEQINDQQIKVLVLDDGMGMSIGMVDQLNRSMIEKGIKIKRKGSGIGLKNIDSRLKDQFGSEYGIAISSRENIGTIVSIMLPIILEGENQ